MFDDLWNGSAFDLIEMTNAINMMPRMGDDISRWIPFTETPVYTTSFALDVTKTGEVELIPSSDRASPGDLMKNDEESAALLFKIPSFIRRATLRNDEVLGARLPGTRSLRILEDERNKKLRKLKQQFDDTKKHQKFSALSGRIVDCDGKLIVDLFQQFGLKKSGMKLKLSDKVNEIDTQLVDAKVRIERMLGMKPDRYELITTEEGNARLRRNKIIKEIQTDPQANYLNRLDGREGVRIASNVFIQYYSAPFVDETKNYLVPIFTDCARTVNGPSSSSQFWGNTLPYYVTKKALDHDEGVEMKGAMHTLSYFTRPDAIHEIVIEE